MENFGAFLKEKCMDFAVDIVNLYKHLCEDKKRVCFVKTNASKWYKCWC